MVLCEAPRNVANYPWESIMRIACAMIAAVLALTAAPASAEEVSDYDRFQLWNKCRPMELIVAKLTDDASDIGLTKNAITVAVRSRLRSARLYSTDDHEAQNSSLYVSVHVVGAAFNIGADYSKVVTDTMIELSYSSPTWVARGFTGTHGRRADYVLSSVSEMIDQFIDEYLRVNEAAC